MKFEISKGRVVMKVTTPEGREYKFLTLSTKPLDQELKLEGKRRANAMRVGFQKAVKKANKAGVALQANRASFVVFRPSAAKNPGCSSYGGTRFTVARSTLTS